MRHRTDVNRSRACPPTCAREYQHINCTEYLYGLGKNSALKADERDDSDQEFRAYGLRLSARRSGKRRIGMLDAVDLIEKLAGPSTTLIPGHGTLVKKQDLLPYRRWWPTSWPKPGRCVTRGSR